MENFDFNLTGTTTDPYFIANGGGLGFDGFTPPEDDLDYQAMPELDANFIANGGGLGFDGFDPGYDEFVIANGGGLGFDGF